MPKTLSSIVETYKRRFNVREPYFPHVPDDNLCLIITIPSYKEPAITETLSSLSKCRPPSGAVEVIITVNSPEDASEEIKAVNWRTVEQIIQWERVKPEFIKPLIICEEALPRKLAGAGLARKIGMDEALQRWALADKDGPIICLDADCTVSENYLRAADKTFSNPSTKISHFHFEHDYEKESDPQLREGIIHYELHLRCYVEGLKFAGYPYALHTVGSCMAVRASSYAKAGGMNRRNAGEDFYFLHKLAPLGGWKNITEATVYPSCRASDRVPFGTGRAQLEWQQGISRGLTYNAGIYEALKPVFHTLPKAYAGNVNWDQFSKPVAAFLNENEAPQKIESMRAQANNQSTFEKRFWQWMDGFTVLKLTHYLRDHGFADQPTLDVAKTLLNGSKQTTSGTIEEVLDQFRNHDRNSQSPSL